MTQQTELNTPLANVNVIDLGAQAVAKWSSRDRNGAQGDALAVVALMNARETMSFHAIVTGPKGEVVEHIDFDLDNYLNNPCNKPDGTRDNKATQARTIALALKVFGITSELTSAQAQSIRRSCDLVRNLVSLGVRAQDVSLSKRGYLEVPYQLMHDEPGEKASERDLKTWEKNKDDSETLDNTDGMSVAKLGQRLNAKLNKVKGSDQKKTDKGAEFVASVLFVNQTLAAFLDADGNIKTDVPAPNKALHAELFNLQTRLNAYFDADKAEAPVKKSKAA